MPGAAWFFALAALGPASVALDPVALPEGWGFLGPIPNGHSLGRDTVTVDPDDCGVRVLVIDAAAGAYGRDVRIARVWDGNTWQYADDWRVINGQVERPGRRNTPLGSVTESLETDAAGRVLTRRAGGRLVSILRNEAGHFLGMAAGSLRAELQFDALGNTIGAVATGDRGTRYTLEGGLVVASARGEATTHYGYENQLLRSILWPDSALLRIERDGTSGHGGRWRCTNRGNESQVVAPGGEVVRIQKSGIETTITGPSGAQVEVTWQGGLLAGWRDPRGVRTEIMRAPDGRIDVIKQDGKDRIRVGGPGSASTSLRIEGQDWTLQRNEAGAVVGRSGPDGRSVEREVDSLGFATRVSAGGEKWTAMRDAGGRPYRLQAGAVGDIRIERELSGAIAKVFDAGGAEWRIERSARGTPLTILDPAGGKWDLRWDGMGRLTGVASPDGHKIGVVRQGDLVSQVVIGSASRWSFLRDPSGRLAGFKTPTGSLWGLARDGAGRIVQARRPDGRSLSLSHDPAGALTRIAGVDIRRTATGAPTELVEGKRSLVRWKRDSAGRVTEVQAAGLEFGVEYDGAGNVVATRVGETRAPITRDGAGRAVSAGETTLSRDGSGLIALIESAGQVLKIGRDLRGRVERVSLLENDWRVGRDVLGRIATLSGPGGLEVGANWDPGGELAMVRLDGGLIVRRNTSADAGEILAFDAGGNEIGAAGWTLDDEQRVDTIIAGGTYKLARDSLGNVMAVEGENESWSRSDRHWGGWDGLDLRQSDETIWELSVSAEGDRVWGLEAGTAMLRRGADGVLTGLDGVAGGASLVHDPLGRLVQYSAGGRDLVVSRDGFGRLTRIGATEVAGWDGILRWGEQTRAPIARFAVARPGGVLLFDPRGFPLLLPWVGALRAWPTGFVPGIETAELGPSGRVAVGAGGPFVSLVDAVDPLSGQVTAGALIFPWTTPATEPPPALSPWASPDAASKRDWDPANWSAQDNWGDPAAVLVGLGLLPGGPAETDGIPGLPWLPASFASELSPALAHTGGIELDEDPVDAYVLGRALAAEPADLNGLFRALLGAELAAEIALPAGVGPALPPFLAAPLASEPFGH